MTSVCQGQERELFIRDFLSLVMPPGMRFGTGEVIDRNGNQSGQLDIVIEFPFSPSLGLTADGPRLYFAEGVGAVIEVKSNIAEKWDSVADKADNIKKLHRPFEAPGFTPFGPPSDTIPFFAVGYKGWTTKETAMDKAASKQLAGLLIVEPGVFCTGKPVPCAYSKDSQWFNSNVGAIEECSLLGFVCALHRAMTSVMATSASLLSYVSSKNPETKIP